MQDIAGWREQALARRCLKIKEKLSEHARDLPPLSLGDAVLVQNQLGNNPRRWEKRGVVVEVLPHRQYKVMMDGSRRISLRNRKFLRSYNPLKITDSPDPRIADKTRPRAPKVAISSESESPQLPIAPQPENSPIVGQEAEQLPIPHLMYPQPDNGGNTDNVPVEVSREGFAPAPEEHSPHSGSPIRPPQFVLTGNQPQPAPPSPSSVASPPVPRRSGRRQTQMPSRYGDFYTGQQFDQATTEINFMESSYPCYQLESPVPPYPQEEIVGLYRVPLPPSQWNLIAWWNGYAWEWTQVA